MKRLFLIKNPELFQGEKYINTDKNYFEGWYFKNTNASFMISIADIPFKLFHFKGIICSLIIDSNEFKFITYNNAKIVKYDVDDNFLNIT